MNSLFCKKCGTKLDYTNIKRLCDLDFERVGLYCKSCFPEVEEALKNKWIVEEYKGSQIYCKDGKYSPYWHSHYYFETLEDARLRIDNKHLAIMMAWEE